MPRIILSLGLLFACVASAQFTPPNNGGGGAPSGPAGGALAGTYPNPSIAAGAVTNAMLVNSSITVTPGTGLTGCGAVSLGGTITCTVSNPVPVNLTFTNPGSALTVGYGSASGTVQPVLGGGNLSTTGRIPYVNASGSLSQSISGNVVNPGAANEILAWWNPTASTGSSTACIGCDGSGTYGAGHTSATTTQVAVVAGQSQGSTPVFVSRVNGGNAIGGFDFEGEAWQSSSGGYLSYSGTGSSGPTGSAVLEMSNTGINMGAAPWIRWGPNTGLGSADVGLSRSSAGVIAVGTGAQGSTAGQLRAAGLASGGTTFTASGCSNSTLVGGATAGTFASGTTGACTVTITMGSSQTAPTGWACNASDLTTPANLISGKTGGSATTAILTGTTVSGDVISFSCMGY